MKIITDIGLKSPQENRTGHTPESCLGWVWSQQPKGSAAGQILVEFCEYGTSDFDLSYSCIVSLVAGAEDRNLVLVHNHCLKKIKIPNWRILVPPSRARGGGYTVR